VFLQRWADKNVKWISDLCDENGQLLDHRSFCDKFEIVTPFTTFLGLVAAIPRSWRTKMYEADNVMEEDDVSENLIDRLESCPKASKLLYNATIKGKCEKPFKILNRWKEELGMEISEEKWLQYLSKMRKFTECNRIRSFLYKFHLRDIPYGRRLFHMEKSDHDKCKWCPKATENIFHLYWQCPKSVAVWRSIASLFNSLYDVQEDLNNLDPLKYLFAIDQGVNKQPKVFDIITALTRYYIHKDKCNSKGKRSIKELENYIKSVMVREWQIATKNGKQNIFIIKWDKLFDPPTP